ncbi:hypothetical protein ASF15_17525 [Pseudomonas sp. Leaf83]|nr:hypothetical protein ASF15_17525 [Pseudomonas sp. Leaf83]
MANGFNSSFGVKPFCKKERFWIFTVWRRKWFFMLFNSLSYLFEWLDGVLIEVLYEFCSFNEEVLYVHATSGA